MLPARGLLAKPAGDNNGRTGGGEAGSLYAKLPQAGNKGNIGSEAARKGGKKTTNRSRKESTRNENTDTKGAKERLTKTCLLQEKQKQKTGIARP